jgi:hypothetical protein
MGLDTVEEYNGYDDVDADQVFNGGRIGGGRDDGSSGGMGNMGGMGEGRRKGKKSLSPRNTHRSKSKRTMGRGFSFNFRGFEDTAKMMLAVTIGALLVCGLILYGTFGMHLIKGHEFYGALAASLVVMALLFYTAAELIGKR